ncbi:hypothetical protein [Rossellomorea sp. BNER]|uniref:hypothetical protein n=1 Tax=Rossellomorea sp. BNER TaxID=2962031 RepID=UPI003AF29522
MERNCMHSVSLQPITSSFPISEKRLHNLNHSSFSAYFNNAFNEKLTIKGAMKRLVKV